MLTKQSVKDYELEPCSCCRGEHHNVYGWILRDKETGMPAYHIDLTPGQVPEITRIPKPGELFYKGDKLTCL